MANFTLDESKIERMKECTNAAEVLSILADEGYELTDEQLEAVSGGGVVDWSFEQLIASFGDAIASLFPTDFDPKAVWANLPTFAGH